MDPHKTWIYYQLGTWSATTIIAVCAIYFTIKIRKSLNEIIALLETIVKDKGQL